MQNPPRTERMRKADGRSSRRKDRGATLERRAVRAFKYGAHGLSTTTTNGRG